MTAVKLGRAATAETRGQMRLGERTTRHVKNGQIRLVCPDNYDLAPQSDGPSAGRSWTSRSGRAAPAGAVVCRRRVRRVPHSRVEGLWSLDTAPYRDVQLPPAGGRGRPSLVGGLRGAFRVGDLGVRSRGTGGIMLIRGTLW